MEGGRIIERKNISVISREARGRIFKTKERICVDEKRKGYKGIRGDKLYKIKISEEC